MAKAAINDTFFKYASIVYLRIRLRVACMTVIVLINTLLKTQ